MKFSIRYAHSSASERPVAVPDFHTAKSSVPAKGLCNASIPHFNAHLSMRRAHLDVGSGFQPSPTHKTNTNQNSPNSGFPTWFSPKSIYKRVSSEIPGSVCPSLVSRRAQSVGGGVVRPCMSERSEFAGPPADNVRSEGTPKGRRGGCVSLLTFLSHNKKVSRPSGRTPGRSRYERRSR